MTPPEQPRDLHVRVALLEQARLYEGQKLETIGAQVSQQAAHQGAQQMWGVEVSNYLREQHRTIESLSRRLEDQAAQGVYLRYAMAAALVMAVATNPAGAWEKLPGLVQLFVR